ncbi:putative reverse transcriptase domain-containing protein [Tanacetum coccineum]
MSSEAIEELIAQRVADALLTYEINWNTRNENRNGSHDVGSGNTRTMHTVRGCTYKEFLNCQPLNFKGTEGAVKYATYTLLNGALTWWNSYVEMVGMDVAYEMSWKDLMKMMTAELVLLCPKMVPNEEEKIERYIWGLPDIIQGNVTSAGPARLQDAIKLANSLLDQKVRVFVTRQAENKRRLENNPRDNHVQHPPYKRQNVARAYTVGPGEKKEYVRTLPLCNKCKFYHTGSCTAKCGNCKRVGHTTKDCRSAVALKNQNRGNPAGNGEARGRVHALGGGEANQDPNIVTGTFLFNNRYYAILFDTDANKSFVSTTFSSLIDIAPSALDTKYDIELADGKTIGF